MGRWNPAMHWQCTFTHICCNDLCMISIFKESFNMFSQQKLHTCYCTTYKVILVFDTCESFSNIWSDRLVLKLFNFARNTHNPQAMSEYWGWGLFLNLKLDPNPVCLKELQRNKLTVHCTWIVQKDSLHFSFVSFTEKRKE